MRGKSGSSDLVARLRIANERMRRLREESESADNVIRFRVERHLEAVEETLGDLNVRAIDVPAAAGSYARRRLEQGLRRAEAEVLFAEAKLGAARAEEIHDVLGFARATVQAMSAPRGASRGREEA